MSKLSFNQSIEDSNLDHINTQIIHPIQINQDTATFNITNRGGSLDKHTTLVLPVTCANAGENNRESFLPINVGIFSVLKSVSLVSNGNGVVIAKNDQPAHYAGLAHSFQEQEFRSRVLKCRHGIFEDYAPSEAGIMNLGAASTAAPSKLTIKNMSYPNGNNGGAYPTTEQTSTTAVDNNSFQGPNNNNYRIQQTSADTARLYISLEQLFPKMYNGLQLPIHLIEAGVSLVLQFSKNGLTPKLNDRACIGGNNLRALGHGGGGAPTVNMNISILTDEVVLLTDYLIAKDDNMLASQVMSPSGLNLQYGDLLWSEFAMKGLAAAAGTRNYQRYEFKLGASNQVIRQMYLFFTPSPNVDLDFKDGRASAAQAAANGPGYNQYNAINCLKGPYSSRPLSTLLDGERIQIKINQQNVFNQPLEQNGHKLHELQTAYGSSFCKPQSSYEMTDFVIDKHDQVVYQAGNNATSVGTFFPPKSLLNGSSCIQGWSVQNLVGSNHYIGINLQKPLLTNTGQLVRANLPGSGTRCGPTPIVIEIDRLTAFGLINDARNVRVCCIVEKTLNIRNGIISVVDN